MDGSYWKTSAAGSRLTTWTDRPAASQCRDTVVQYVDCGATRDPGEERGKGGSGTWKRAREDGHEERA